jgi:hypothetical protein
VTDAARRAGGWRVPPPWPAAEFGVAKQADRDWVDRRLTDHPFGTFVQPAGAASPEGILRFYVACTAPRRETYARFADAARDDAGWEYAELHTGHDAMITAPGGLARLLLDVLNG